MGQAPLQPALRRQPGLWNPQRWWGHPAKPLCSACSEMLALRPAWGPPLPASPPPLIRQRRRSEGCCPGWELCGAVLFWPPPVPRQVDTLPRPVLRSAEPLSDRHQVCVCCVPGTEHIAVNRTEVPAFLGFPFS